MKNLYQTLSISPSATSEQIKTAYTNAVLKAQAQPNFTSRFEEIQQAYDILSNPASRKAFDAELLNFYTGSFNNVQTKAPKPEPQKQTQKGNTPPPPKQINPIPIYKDLRYITLAFVGAIILVMLLKTCTEDKYATPTPVTPQTSRDLSTNDFNPNKSPNSGNSTPTVIDIPVTHIDPVLQDSLNLISLGYKPRKLKNGGEPDCFNYTPQKSSIGNKLIVDVGYGTDVVVKLISKDTERCIRYFYIRGGSSYTIYGIPQGIYYLKLAYGKQWMMTNEGGQCKGKFLRDAKYEVGDQILNYNFKYSADGGGYSIPSFHLKLGVSYNLDNSDNFRSDKISEEKFNN